MVTSFTLLKSCHRHWLFPFKAKKPCMGASVWVTPALLDIVENPSVSWGKASTMISTQWVVQMNLAPLSFLGWNSFSAACFDLRRA